MPYRVEAPRPNLQWGAVLSAAFDQNGSLPDDIAALLAQLDRHPASPSPR